jgi:hypothetical protein
MARIRTVAIFLTAWMQALGLAQQPCLTVGAKCEGVEAVTLPPPTAPIDTSLCEIAKTPLSLQHKLVRFRSYASGRGIDSPPTLYDPACKRPVFPELPNVTHNYQMRRLQDCLAQPFAMPARSHPAKCVSIQGTFVGVVDYSLTTDGENPIRLKVQDVSDLVIELSKKR